MDAMRAVDSMGLMVFRKIAPPDMVAELLGGVCVECWVSVDNYIQDGRSGNRRDSISEWFRWLVERLQ